MPERAELAQILLRSIDEFSESEVESLWQKEAERRLREFREGKTQGIPAEVVFREAMIAAGDAKS